MNDIRISIVTVCYNAERCIEKTIKSVLQQEYENIEYIIIDGNSQDSTIEIIEKMNQFNKIKWITEPDCGIYDAMNKGIGLVTGEYIHFLNAGDFFYTKYIVKEVVEEIRKKRADIYYGDIVYQSQDGEKMLRKYGKWCGKKIYFLTGDCINHQALFSNVKCFSQMKFDIKYKICADRDWMMRVKKEGVILKKLDFIICNYSLDLDSASIANKKICEEEADACIRKHFPLGYIIFCIFSFMRRNYLLSKLLHCIYEVLYIKK